MSFDRHERVRELFLATSALSSDEREQFLARLRQEDEALEREVRLLITESELNPDFLENPIIDAAFRSKVSDEILKRDDALLAVAGPYRLLRVIGEGAFSRVYLAQQGTPIRRHVAVKVLRSGVDSQAVLRRFEAEQQALASLNHPSIVKIIESDCLSDGSGRPYFVMEYVEGEPITAFADRRGLKPRQRLELVALACEAIQHAHLHGLIHRDLKPSNVLVTEVDGPPVPKIIDFGLAKAIGAMRLTEHTLQTTQGELLGTLAYMSPEQLSGESDIRSDVYALGALAYELLAARPPIDVKNVPIAEAIRRIAEETPLTVSRMSVASHRDLDVILATALAKNPAQRYQSVSALLDDLRRFQSGEPILARKASAARVLAAFVRRHRVTSAVVVLAGTVVIVAAVVAITEGMRARLAERRWAARVGQITRDWLVELESRAGTFELWKRVAADAREDARELLARDPNNADFLDLSAFATRHLSRIAFETRDYADCLALREEAYRLRRAAASANPSNATIRKELALDMVLIGDVHWQLGDMATQRVWLDRSAELTRQLAVDDPSTENRSRLAWSYQRLGGNELYEGRFDSAREYVEESLRLLHTLLEEDATNVSALECMRLDYAYLAVLAQRDGRRLEISRCMQESLRLAERLVEIDGTNRHYLIAYLHALFTHADYCADRSEAYRLYEAGYRRAENLLSLEPHHKEGLVFTSSFAQRAAVCALQQGDPAKARKLPSRSGDPCEPHSHGQSVRSGRRG